MKCLYTYLERKYSLRNDLVAQRVDFQDFVKKVVERREIVSPLVKWGDVLDFVFPNYTPMNETKHVYVWQRSDGTYFADLEDSREHVLHHLEALGYPEQGALYRFDITPVNSQVNPGATYLFEAELMTPGKAAQDKAQRKAEPTESSQDALYSALAELMGKTFLELSRILKDNGL